MTDANLILNSLQYEEVMNKYLHMSHSLTFYKGASL